MTDFAALEAKARAYYASDKWPPYARELGMELDHFVDGVPVFTCPYNDNIIGRPGFFHGGALSGIMEFSAIAALESQIFQSDKKIRIKPVNITINFMRGARNETVYAMGKITRLGRRVANVEAMAWQSDKNKPVAQVTMNFMLKEQEVKEQ